MALVLMAVPGCLRKASWIANEKGGYTLFANVESVDQAVIRFHRSARVVRPILAVHADPAVRRRAELSGERVGPPSTILDARSDLTCNR